MSATRIGAVTSALLFRQKHFSLEAFMSKLVPYIRNSDGTIERVADAIYNTEGNLTAPYLHEEPLVGFPESKVFWAKKFGPSLGVSPYYGHLKTPS